MRADRGDLFNNEDQASSYAKFRPTYPRELYGKILQFADLPSRGLAVDLGCGTGQATRILAQEFDRVIGIDPSEAQIAQTPTLENVDFRVGRAESSGLPSHSVDLITIAQAMHWLDPPVFYEEVVRLLKPHGALAAWGYGLPTFDVPEANAWLEGFYEGLLGPYWDEGRRKIEQRYEGMEPPAGMFKEVKRIKVEMVRSVTFAGLMGYFSSWSAYATYRKKHPSEPDPLVDLKSSFAAVLGSTADEDPINLTTEIFVILAKHPNPNHT